MRTQKNKDTLSLAYKMLDDTGSLRSKSIIINNINTDVTDVNLYEFALLVKEVMAYAAEKVLRRSETEYLED